MRSSYLPHVHFRSFTLPFALVAFAGCASTRSSVDVESAPPSHAVSSPPSKSAPTVDAIARTRGELALLARDLSVLDGRLPSALSAVNFTVMRFPACIDVLFDRYAQLDLDRRAISLEEQDLRRTLDAVIAGEETGTMLVRVENRARALRDRIALMNKDLALLFADAMSQKPSCAPAGNASPNLMPLER